MLLKQIDRKNVLKAVKQDLRETKKEILATMLLIDELSNPLPSSYFNLLKKKVNEGVFLKRLGFGRKEDYNEIKERNKLESNNYKFKYIVKESEYQRLIILDRKKIFFGVYGVYFTSVYEPLIKMFADYFDSKFKKGKI